MDYSVNIRSIADMTCIQFEFEKFLDSFWWQGDCRAFGQVVNKRVNSAEIYGANEKLHMLYPGNKERIRKIIIYKRKTIRVFRPNRKKIEVKLRKFLKCWKPLRKTV